MGPRVLAVCLALACASARAQAVDANLQNLLVALTNGAETTLVTPLRSGMLQVTSFNPGGRLTPSEANLLVNRARDQLQALGDPQPTAEVIARMLAGGPIELPSGRIHVAGMLPNAGRPATIRSQIVAAGTPLPGTPAAASAAGGTAPVAARELAIQQLATLGIINPSEDQIRTALVGGRLTTVNGVYELPGILTR